MANAENAPKIEEEVSVHRGEPDSRGRRVTPWSWVPTVYFAQGLQYTVVIQLFVIIFFTMGVPIGKTLFWIGLLQLPWTIKPLWGPLVDKYWTKRRWTYTMQFLVGIAFVATAFSLLLPSGQFFVPAVFFLFGLAFAAATHDIACDGYYMMGLNEKQQAFFVGVRSTVFRGAWIFSNGVLVFLAGYVQSMTGLEEQRLPLVVAESRETAEAPAQSADDVFQLQNWPETEEQSIQIMPQPEAPAGGEAEGEGGIGVPKGGNTYVTVRLSQPLDEGTEKIVTLEFEEGDFGFKIPKEFERLVFTPENRQEGITVPISVEEKAGIGDQDALIAKSGNIAFSWWLVCFGCAIFFLCIFVYHRFLLPYPDSDYTAPGSKPNFLWPLLLLGLTIGVPWAIGYGLYWGMGKLREDVMAMTIGPLEVDALQDLQEFVVPDEESEEQPVDIEELAALADQIRDAGQVQTASELRKGLKFQEYLEQLGIADDPDLEARIWESISAVREDDTVYGTQQVRTLFEQLEELNPQVPEDADAPEEGEEPEEEPTLPRTREEVGSAIARSSAAIVDELPENADRLLGALAAAEKIESEMAEEGEEPTALNRAELDRIVTLAREAPRPIEVQGFTFFFTAGRLLILLAIGAIILWTPPLWHVARTFFYTLSDASQIGFAEVFGTFFSKTGMGITLGFLLTFRLGEAQLAQVKGPFLLDVAENNGMAMTLGEFAFTNGIVYLALLTVGGLIGGFMIARYGLKKVIWPMVAFMHLPNLLYLYLSEMAPSPGDPLFGSEGGIEARSFAINSVVGFESFGYGLGFTAYLMVMILAAQGRYKTAHYALCTGAMALGYMIPGMWAGYLQELTGYSEFFILVMIFTLPGIAFIPFLKIDPDFGKKAHTEKQMEEPQPSDGGG